MCFMVTAFDLIELKYVKGIVQPCGKYPCLLTFGIVDMQRLIIFRMFWILYIRGMPC